MIHVIATISLHPGTRPAFLNVFRKLMPLVREEPGCIEYQAVIDLATTLSLQDDPREDVVVVVEKWDSVEALYAHTEAEHMDDYRAQVREMVRSVGLQVMEPV